MNVFNLKLFFFYGCPYCTKVAMINNLCKTPLPIFYKKKSTVDVVPCLVDISSDKVYMIESLEICKYLAQQSNLIIGPQKYPHLEQIAIEMDAMLREKIINFSLNHPLLSLDYLNPQEHVIAMNDNQEDEDDQLLLLNYLQQKLTEDLNKLDHNTISYDHLNIFPWLRKINMVFSLNKSVKNYLDHISTLTKVALL